VPFVDGELVGLLGSTAMPHTGVFRAVMLLRGISIARRIATPRCEESAPKDQR